MLDEHFVEIIDDYLKNAENAENAVFTEMVRKLFILGFKMGKHRDTVKLGLEKFTKGQTLKSIFVFQISKKNQKFETN